MDITERVQKLHEIMRQNKVDIYIVPTADFHQSEYVGEYFKMREFLTGFTDQRARPSLQRTKLTSGRTADILSRLQRSWRGRRSDS